ncbi:MAG: hypothetical protein H6620_10540 [Halobacteriovoraceae bacterium]|nr:hypothetical protein [Halobacteriovoraceae bacterium]
MIESTFPIIKKIELVNLRPYYEGRITVDQLKKEFTVEVCLVHAESQKIFQFVDQLYGFDDPKDALDSGVQRLSQYLKGHG